MVPREQPRRLPSRCYLAAVSGGYKRPRQRPDIILGPCGRCATQGPSRLA